RAPALTTETDIGAAAPDAENLVDARMVVRVVEHAVAPAVAPAMAFEQVLEHRGRIEPVRQVDSAMIDDERPAGVIGNESVVGKAKLVCLALADQRHQLRRIRTGPAAHLRDNLRCTIGPPTTDARQPCSWFRVGS